MTLHSRSLHYCFQQMDEPLLRNHYRRLECISYVFTDPVMTLVILLGLLATVVSYVSYKSAAIPIYILVGTCAYYIFCCIFAGIVARYYRPSSSSVDQVNAAVTD